MSHKNPISSTVFADGPITRVVGRGIHPDQMKDPETFYQGTIHNLKSALQEIAGGTKVRKNKGACAQINLSALEMQQIAAKALEENED